MLFTKTTGSPKFLKTYPTRSRTYSGKTSVYNMAKGSIRIKSIPEFIQKIPRLKGSKGSISSGHEDTLVSRDLPVSKNPEDGPTGFDSKKPICAFRFFIPPKQ